MSDTNQPRQLRFDTLALTFKAEAEFWRTRALVLQDDYNMLQDDYKKIDAAYTDLKKNSKPGKPPASPVDPVTEK